MVTKKKKSVTKRVTRSPKRSSVRKAAPKRKAVVRRPAKKSVTKKASVTRKPAKKAVAKKKSPATKKVQVKKQAKSLGVRRKVLTAEGLRRKMLKC